MDTQAISFKKYDFWRYHGLSPQLSLHLAALGIETPELYEQKQAVDNASNGGEFTNTIGLIS